MRHTLRNIWQWLRTLSGDNAYEHYLVHWQQHHHAQETQPLDRKAFYEIEQQHKWSGINRCC
ncbi:MAG: YbdD/YjiX family protein [Gammaproteobacteria bacterium]|nr:YbdD/YjiX family protein [Gammaproteobacteria bacterium]